MPGTTRNPASITQVNNEAKMLYSRGISSRCKSICIYRVCIEGIRVKGGLDDKVSERLRLFGLLESLRFREFEGLDLWAGAVSARLTGLVVLRP